MYNLETIKKRTFDYDDIGENFTERFIILKKEFGDDFVINMFEDKILDLKDPYISLAFCKHVRGANIKAHGKIIIDSSNAYVNYHFAKDNIKSADIDAHRKVVLESKNPYLNYLFVIDVLSRLDLDFKKINEHKNIIKEAKEYIYLDKLNNYLNNLKENNIIEAQEKAMIINESIDCINELINIKKYNLPRQKN